MGLSPRTKWARGPIPAAGDTRQPGGRSNRNRKRGSRMRAIICGVDGSHPVVAAVDGSAASTAALDTAVRLAAEINTPAGLRLRPTRARRLLRHARLPAAPEAAMAKARRVLDRALWAAARAGVTAESEILEGAPGKASSSSPATAARAWWAPAPTESRAQRLLRRHPHRGRPVVVAQGSDRGGGDVRQPSGRGPISRCDRPCQPHR
jgi:hypothetical protein